MHIYIGQPPAGPWPLSLRAGGSDPPPRREMEVFCFGFGMWYVASETEQGNLHGPEEPVLMLKAILSCPSDRT